jgi:hypothetical protein
MAPRFSTLERTLDNLSLRLSPQIRKSDVRRQKASASAILWRMYGSPSVPGVILGDEVGMGKTYVALAVAAALAAHRRPRILILAHSREMAAIWKKRWDMLATANSWMDFPDADEICSLDEIPKGIWFAAYDTLKHVSSAELQSTLREVLRGRGTPRGIYRKRLTRDLFGHWRLEADHEVEISKSARREFWNGAYDWNMGEWASIHRAEHLLKRLYFDSLRRKSQLDLLIVDEAHKLEAGQRDEFFDRVFSARAHRVLLVTATPFSLSVEELLSRVRNLFDFCGHDPATVSGQRGRLRALLEDYRKKIDSRQAPAKSLKSSIQEELGAYFVRSTWPSRQRVPHPLVIPKQYTQDGQQAFAMLRLEKAFAELYDSGGRTQIAQNRVTLCSSYAAVTNSSHGGNEALESLRWFLSRLKRNSKQEHPKLEFCVDWLAKNIRPPDKIVVFSNRLASIGELYRRLGARFRHGAERLTRQWDQYRKPPDLSPEALAKLRMAFYSNRDLVRRSPCEAIQWADEIAEDQEAKYWVQAWGKRRHARWVSTLSGERTGLEGGRSNEVVRFAFNLPGPPYILICSPIAREGIDLHKYCRKVMHYDLEWSPTAMEQRVGRVDRVGSLANQTGEPVETYIIRNPGTYEDRILNVVNERMKMVRVLLGAGEWLRSDSLTTSFDNLDQYRLDFSPK